MGMHKHPARPSSASPGLGSRSLGASQMHSRAHQTSVKDVLAQPNVRTLRPFKRQVPVAKGNEILRQPVDYVSVAMARGLSAELAGTPKSVAVWLKKRARKTKDRAPLDRSRELLFGKLSSSGGIFGAPPRAGYDFRSVRRQRPFVTRIKQSKHKKKSRVDEKMLRVAALDSALERECERRMSQHRRALGLLPPKH